MLHPEKPIDLEVDFKLKSLGGHPQPGAASRPIADMASPDR